MKTHTTPEGNTSFEFTREELLMVAVAVSNRSDAHEEGGRHEKAATCHHIFETLAEVLRTMPAEVTA